MMDADRVIPRGLGSAKVMAKALGLDSAMEMAKGSDLATPRGSGWVKGSGAAGSPKRR